MVVHPIPFLVWLVPCAGDDCDYGDGYNVDDGDDDDDDDVAYMRPRARATRDDIPEIRNLVFPVAACALDVRKLQ